MAGVLPQDRSDCRSGLAHDLPGGHVRLVVAERVLHPWLPGLPGGGNAWFVFSNVNRVFCVVLRYVCKCLSFLLF